MARELRPAAHRRTFSSSSKTIVCSGSLATLLRSTRASVSGRKAGPTERGRFPSESAARLCVVARACVLFWPFESRTPRHSLPPVRTKNSRVRATCPPTRLRHVSSARGNRDWFQPQNFAFEQLHLQLRHRLAPSRPRLERRPPPLQPSPQSLRADAGAKALRRLRIRCLRLST